MNPKRLVKDRPILLGYTAAVATLTFILVAVETLFR